MLKTINKIRNLFDYHRAPVITDLTAYEALLVEIQAYSQEHKLAHNDTVTLQQMAGELKAQTLQGVSCDQLLVRAGAVFREAAYRVLGLRPFDSQILAGIALHQGKIIEMLTGEGKTLAAVLPACLNALAGKGVHIFTFNDYLAKRDAHWMEPIYSFFGMTVGHIQSGMAPAERKKAYDCDVTYLTAKEAGFDHLRSFLCLDPADLLQRPFNYVIIDEADSLLIDEGRIPLVIAGSRPFAGLELDSLTRLVKDFQPGIDYSMDEHQRNVFLTERGVAYAEKCLKCGNLYTPENLTLLTLLNNALHAEVLLKRDVDYIVREGKVELVDEFTGRVIENRHWPDGLQEALEAKEGLRNHVSGQILGTITLQHFLNCYPKIAGMTGTARTAADEFKEFYNLDLVVIPPNRPYIRVDEPDLIFGTNEAKYAALIREITSVHATGRPILIGTSSVQESEKLAGMLDEAQIPYQLLNAKNDELEAEIIAQAGALGAVTISTNMAGRGTDIQLGGLDGSGKVKVSEREQRDRVAALGGLYVIGTHHFESARVDLQLRGRSGRQGAPGSSRFYISLEDDLIVRYGIKELIPVSYRHYLAPEPITDPVVRRQIISAQKIIEAQNFEIRKNLWEYSWIVEQKRQIIQNRRQRILLDREEPDIFAAALPKQYRELEGRVGEKVLKRVEKYVTLHILDQLWAEFLEEVSQIRESIYLVNLSGRTPLVEFHREVGKAFLAFQQRIEEEIVAALNRVEISEAGIDLEKEGLRGPSATWTYLVNDTPFGSKLEMFLGPLLKNILKKSSQVL